MGILVIAGKALPLAAAILSALGVIVNEVNRDVKMNKKFEKLEKELKEGKEEES